MPQPKKRQLKITFNQLDCTIQKEKTGREKSQNSKAKNELRVHQWHRLSLQTVWLPTPQHQFNFR